LINGGQKHHSGGWPEKGAVDKEGEERTLRKRRKKEERKENSRASPFFLSFFIFLFKLYTCGNFNNF